MVFFFFQAEDGIRDLTVTGVQTCALPISAWAHRRCGRRFGLRRPRTADRSEEHTSELQSQSNLVCRLLLEKKKKVVLARRISRFSNSLSSRPPLILTTIRKHNTCGCCPCT